MLIAAGNSQNLVIDRRQQAGVLGRALGSGSNHELCKHFSGIIGRLLKPISQYFEGTAVNFKPPNRQLVLSICSKRVKL